MKDALLIGRLRYPESFSHMVFQSPHMLSAMQYLEAVAPSMEAVLVLGETGVGKGVAVRALQRLSNPKIPMVTVNVGGVDDIMFSDTLFGHVKGAFTGADSHRHGMIAKAKGGILFLDEIGDLSELSQSKLLHLIQEGTYCTLGSDTLCLSEVRIVCATNRKLSALVKAGRFRADLYYRLKVHQVRIPPLRERLADIAPLTHYFLEEAARSQNKPTPTPPAELFTLLATHSFPGNVRELRALIYDAVTRHGKGVLSLAVFREALGYQPVQRPMANMGQR